MNSDAAIIASVKGEHKEALHWLLERGQSVDAREGQPLIEAASKGNLYMVQFLIGRGANPQALFGMPLVAAAENGHVDVVAYLVLECGIRVEMHHNKAIMKASTGGHKAVVEFILSQYPAIDTLTLSLAMQEADIHGHDQLVQFFSSIGASWERIYEKHHWPMALGRGSAKVVQYAIGRNILTPLDTRLVLLYAAEKGRLDTVKVLLNSETIGDASVVTEILRSIVAKRTSVSKVMLSDHRCRPSPSECEALMHWAVRTEASELYRAIIQKCNYSPATQERWAVLAASRSGSIAQMQALVERNVPISPHAREALKYAIMSGSPYMVELLKRQGGEWERECAQEYFDLLLESNDCISMLGSLMEGLPGYNPFRSRYLVEAAKKNSIRVVQFLANRGSTLFSLSSSIQDALDGAAHAGHLEMVRLLLSLGGDPTADDAEASRLALTNGHIEVVYLFLAYKGGIYREALVARLSTHLEPYICGMQPQGA